MKYKSLAGLALFFLIGFIVGQRFVLPSSNVTGVYNIGTPKSESVDFEPFWKTWNIINENYVGAARTTSAATKVWGAIEGLVSSLGDPYTVFFPPDEAKVFEEMISGSFGGVGMEIGEEDGVLVVIAPLKNSPAERSGVRSGDTILAIDEMRADALHVDEAVGLIRGEPGTVVELTIARKGETGPRTIVITRDTILVPTLDTTYISDNDIFVVSIYNFDAHVTEDFKKAMEQFAALHTDRLILDLRGNPGGFLDAAVSVASYFVPEGEIIVREVSDGHGEIVHRSSGYARPNKPLSMVVLVDSGTASASEILAGALQEHGIAELIGTQTFGKGSVQELIRITDDTALKLTVAQWLTPNGVSISEGGLTPDQMVDVSEADIAAGRDPQLAAAITRIVQLNQQNR